MSFEREKMRDALAALAAEGVYLGTSSWKYQGWLDTLYMRDRYVWRGRFAESRFERQCLAEYAEVFKTVSVDAAYYQYPTRDYLGGLMDQVPADFQFGFKVTDDITIKRFANLPRFGTRAGRTNENFLNADRFATAFLQPCAEFRSKVGLLMFEFSRFRPEDFARGRDFVAALDAFLGQLPRGWPYAVEIRNKNFLHPDYFAVLARHGVAHVFNNWTHMPPVAEQIELPDAFPNPDLFAARFLLRPGRTFEEAVQKFSPYDRLQEPNLQGRAAARKLVIRAKKKRVKRAYLYCNNRFEGNSLASLAALVEEVKKAEASGGEGGVELPETGGTPF